MANANNSGKLGRVIMERLTDHAGANTREFDREFWQRAGPQAIWNAMGMLRYEYLKMCGLRGPEPRMRRDVERIIIRERRLPPELRPKPEPRPKP